MFELKKSKYPNLWVLITMGNAFCDGDKPKNLCQVCQRVLLGIFMSFLIILCGSFIGWIVIVEPLAYLILGNYFVSRELLIAGAVIWGIFFFIFGCALFLYLKEETSLFSPIKEWSENRQPTLIEVWYKGFKEKYCPSVKMVDDDWESF